MARKKEEPIKGLARKKDAMVVQKSLPLFALWRSPLTLSEFKILDIYLARINSHHPEKRSVVLSRGDLEQALEVNKINMDALKGRLRHLMGTVVEIPDATTKRGFKLVTLFEEAEAELAEDGLWTITLECTAKAQKYFFNVESLGYLRYKLRCIMTIKSRYAYIMFTYIEANRYRKTWVVSVDDLRETLGCTDETYKSYKRFNDLVLKKTKKELDEKTDCHFTYDSIRSGRRITQLQITVETLSLSDTEEDPNQITIEQWQNEKNKNRDTICEGLSDPAFDGFTEDQLKVLVSLVAEKGYTGKDAALRLKTCFATAQEKGAKHVFDYMKKMIENEKKKAEKKTGMKFNDIPQRDYNYDDLERQLLAAQDDARRRQDN